MKVTLDNIVFSLQRFGGISVVWKEVEQRAIADSELEVKVLDYPSHNSNRDLLQLTQPQLISQKARWMERYRQPVCKYIEDGIFHSSYFRIVDKPNVRNITTIHDLTYHYFRSGLAKRVHLWQEQYALEHSKGIICVSAHTQHDMLVHYPQLKEEQTHVIYNGVSDCFRMTDCANLTPFDSKGYLLYVGNRSAKYKNFWCAVEVAAQVHMPLVIVGDELSEIERKQMNEKLGEGHYHIKEYPRQDELVAIYTHAYCLLYPSAYEGFGLPIVEAQRTGCMVIGQAISSIPEVMGKGGICVEANQDNTKVIAAMREALDQLIQGRIDAQSLRAEGLSNSQHFTWDKTYKQVKQVYRKYNI